MLALSGASGSWMGDADVHSGDKDLSSGLSSTLAAADEGDEIAVGREPPATILAVLADFVFSFARLQTR